ncbi:Hypothetical protein GLP15_2742 [Giardia lamblia P15]|uniref:Uncharacterized protein n=1 Tax=Giardia intestinalis (strain P15) TaxID=658858 RepID=E1F8Y4_GIAIA|nr:Hypothetical protein GLP15_2742 [Giardia lamblia P15]
MVPLMDANISTTTFIPVLKESDPSSSVSSHTDLQSNSEEKETSRYVVVISISPGDAPVHLTTSASQSACVRSGPCTLEMSTDEMVRRITLGRPIARSYDLPKFEYLPRTPGPEVPEYLLDYQDKGSITRKELLLGTVSFLTAKRIATRTSRIKVVMFHGSSLTRTIQVDREPCNVITTDGEKFPATYKGYHIDLKGSTTEPLSLRGALHELLRLIASSLASLLQLPHARLQSTAVPTVPRVLHRTGMERLRAPPGRLSIARSAISADPSRALAPLLARIRRHPEMPVWCLALMRLSCQS